MFATFATNVTGSFLCAREAVKRMAYRHGGRGGAIVNVSSAASRLGAPHEYLDYAASKGAIDTFTTGLSLEVAAQGIRVNAVRPGFIYTDMHADGGEPGRVDRVRELIPMKRGGTPEEVAQATNRCEFPSSARHLGLFLRGERLEQAGFLHGIPIKMRVIPSCITTTSYRR